jgi:hypothetical protein
MYASKYYKLRHQYDAESIYFLAEIDYPRKFVPVLPTKNSVSLRHSGLVVRPESRMKSAKVLRDSESPVPQPTIPNTQNLCVTQTPTILREENEGGRGE